MGPNIQTKRQEKILERATRILKEYLKPARIILFGSRGKGQFHPGSDFDLAVDKERPGIRTERKIREELEEVAGLYHVDIVYLPEVDGGFKNLIVKTGKVIYER